MIDDEPPEEERMKRPRFVEPKRRPWLGILLMTTYLSSFGLVAWGVYRIEYVAGRVAESSPMDDAGRRAEAAIQSTRYALYNGPRGQRVAILQALGSKDLPVEDYIEDLRRLIMDRDPLIASEAMRAYRQAFPR